MSKHVSYDDVEDIYIDILKALYQITDLQGNIIDEVFDPSHVLVPEGILTGIRSVSVWCRSIP